MEDKCCTVHIVCLVFEVHILSYDLTLHIQVVSTDLSRKKVNQPEDMQTSVPSRPTVRGMDDWCVMSSRNFPFMLRFCSSKRILVVCLKCTSFIWGREYRIAANSRFSCPATDKFWTVNQGTSSNSTDSLLVSFVFFGGTGRRMQASQSCNGIGQYPWIAIHWWWLGGLLRFSTHGICILSFFWAASARFSLVVIHNRPPFGWKNNCWLRFFMCLATWPDTSEMKQVGKALKLNKPSTWSLADQSRKLTCSNTRTVRTY